MTNKVTILIAVKNGSETLDRCFESIYKQTFRNFFVVCVNDFSTDNDKTSNILNKWKNKFTSNQFSIINNEKNLGLTKSLNKGLAQIDSTFIARIDDDDWWHPKKLEKQIAFLKNHPDYGVIGCCYINYGKNYSKKIILPKEDRAIKKALVKRNPFAHSCIIFRTDLIKKLGAYDESVKYGQDYELWWRCYPHTKFYNLPEFLCYRTIGRGISMEKQKDQMKQGIKTQIKYFRKYNLPYKNYIYLFELLMLVITPNFIKKIKYRLFD